MKFFQCGIAVLPKRSPLLFNDLREIGFYVIGLRLVVEHLKALNTYQQCFTV